jgi:FSR family fosmidomycin resistance protein-like MFS transporter
LKERPRNRLLILLSASHSLNHSFFWIASPILLLITSNLVGASITNLGLIGTIGSFIYGLGSILAGSLVDRRNEIHLIMLSSGLAGFSTVMFLFAQNIVIYAALFISMCMWTGLYHPVANALISKAFSGATGEAMGLHGAGGTIGIVFTPVLSLAVGLAFGWRISFVVFGVSAVVIAILFSKSQFSHKQTPAKIRMLDVFRIAGMWPLLVFNFVVGLYMKSVELFLPAYLALGPLGFMDEKEAINLAAIFTSIMLLIGALGQWLGGRQTEVWGSKKVIIVASSTVLISFLFLLLTPSSLWFVAIIAFIALYGIAFYGHQPAFNALAGFTTPEDKRGMVYGVLFFFSFGMGSISQAIIGYLSDKAGVTTSFFVLTLFAAIAFITSLFMSDIRETTTKHQQ